MTIMSFFGFLNEDGTVTQVTGAEPIVLPIGPVDWGVSGPPKESDYTNRTRIVLERSMLSGYKCDGMTILGLFKYLLILVDHEGLCYSLDWLDSSSTK